MVEKIFVPFVAAPPRAIAERSKPRSSWLPPKVERIAKTFSFGSVATGPELPASHVAIFSGAAHVASPAGTRRGEALAVPQVSAAYRPPAFVVVGAVASSDSPV